MSEDKETDLKIGLEIRRRVEKISDDLNISFNRCYMQVFSMSSIIFGFFIKNNAVN